MHTSSATKYLMLNLKDVAFDVSLKTSWAEVGFPQSTFTSQSVLRRKEQQLLMATFQKNISSNVAIINHLNASVLKKKVPCSI